MHPTTLPAVIAILGVVVYGIGLLLYGPDLELKFLLVSNGLLLQVWALYALASGERF